MRSWKQNGAFHDARCALQRTKSCRIIAFIQFIIRLGTIVSINNDHDSLFVVRFASAKSAIILSFPPFLSLSLFLVY